jgi:hypothetical protein
VATGFGDDLDATLDQPALAAVMLESCQRHARHFLADQLNSLDNIGQARDGRA